MPAGVSNEAAAQAIVNPVTSIGMVNPTDPVMILNSIFHRKVLNLTYFTGHGAWGKVG